MMMGLLQGLVTDTDIGHRHGCHRCCRVVLKRRHAISREEAGVEAG